MAKARLKFLRSMGRLRSLPAKRNILSWGAVFAVLALGTSLRLYRLDDQSLWGDEALSRTSLPGMPRIRFLRCTFTHFTAGSTYSASVLYRPACCRRYVGPWRF